MWNSFKTDAYSGILAEAVVLPGRRNVPIHAYLSRPLGTQSAPSLVLIPHMPGWDEWCRETARRFSEHGYAVLCPNIYEEVGHGTPSEVAQRSMDRGGVPDSDVMGDVAASLGFLSLRPTGGWASSACAPAAATPSSPPAPSPALTRRWTAGAAAWSARRRS